MLYLLIPNILCFVWPLLLTLKVLTGAYNKRHPIDVRNSDQVKFLLNYWICFIAVDYIEKMVLCSAMFWPFVKFGYFPDLFSSTVKIWLFYNHGCLVINYCYLDLLLRKVTCDLGSVDSFEGLEMKLINPVMKTLLAESYLAPLKLLSNKTKSQIFGRIVQFSEGFAKSGDKSFLQFSLDNICYMDSEQDLERNFEITKTFIGSVMSFLQNQLVLLNFQEEPAAPISRFFQVLLIPNIQNVGSQNTLKNNSFNERFEPIHMDLTTTKTNNKSPNELEYKSQIGNLVQKYSINKKLVPRSVENSHFTTYTKRKLKRSSSKSKYLDNAICGYIPSTISKPFQLRRHK